MRSTHCAVAVALLLVAAVAFGGCAGKSEQQTLTPLIAPPLIAEEGVLRVGVDLNYPPFAGTDKGVEAGIDVDLAAAIAERLGLRVELVDVQQSEITTALSDGTIDIMLGATAITSETLASVSTAGSYLIDGPAMYARVSSGSVDATLTPDGLAGRRVVTQKSSESYWLLQNGYGEGFATSHDTLRQAFEALVADTADVVVGDAAICSYIARDYQDVRYVGQFAPGRPIGIMVKKDATQLEEKVRGVLDALASQGVLGIIEAKWLGSFPELEAATE